MVCWRIGQCRRYSKFILESLMNRVEVLFRQFIKLNEEVRTLKVQIYVHNERNEHTPFHLKHSISMTVARMVTLLGR